MEQPRRSMSNSEWRVHDEMRCRLRCCPVFAVADETVIACSFALCCSGTCSSSSSSSRASFQPLNTTSQASQAEGQQKDLLPRLCLALASAALPPSLVAFLALCASRIFLAFIHQQQ